MKARISPRTHAISGLFVFLLIAIFAVLSLLSVLLSVQSYTGITSDVNTAASSRVLEGYLRSKVRAHDRAGALRLMEADAGTVLCLDEDGLETRIYITDGYLTEQLCDPQEPFEPELGERLVKANSLRGEKSRDGQLTLSITDAAGKARTLVMTLRCGGEGAAQ